LVRVDQRAMVQQVAGQVERVGALVQQLDEARVRPVGDGDPVRQRRQREPLGLQQAGQI